MIKLFRPALVTLLVSACSSFGDYRLEVGDEVRTQRGFFDYPGPGAELLSHTIAVGHPGDISYVYDLLTGRLVGVWRGGFIDARGMWQGRGRGSFTALGDVHFLGKSRPLTATTAADNLYRGRGYRIEVPGGIPTFRYSLNHIEVTDRISPLPGTRGVQHRITLSQLDDSLHYQLASAGSITPGAGGAYIVDGGQFIIDDIQGGDAHISSDAGGANLIVAIREGTLRYSVRW